MRDAKILASKNIDDRTVHVIEGSVRVGEQLAAVRADGTLEWVRVTSADVLSIAVSRRAGGEQGEFIG